MNAILLAACVSVVMPVDLDNEVESLRGLPGVHVVLDSDGALAEGLGFVKAWVEILLLRNGIHVLTENEMRRLPSRPQLIVVINDARWRIGFEDEPTIAVASVGVELRQAMRREIEPDGPFIAETWSTGGLVGSGKKGFNTLFVKEYLELFINEFSNDYLKVNPKHPVEKKDAEKP